MEQLTLFENNDTFNTFCPNYYNNSDSLYDPFYSESFNGNFISNLSLHSELYSLPSFSELSNLPINSFKAFESFDPKGRARNHLISLN